MRTYLNKANFCSFQNVLKALHDTHCIKGNQPMFTISSGQVEILEKPIDFYINLHQGIKQSRRRILWNSLYMGHGNMEKYLIENLTNHINKVDQIRFQILLDYYRATRREEKTGESSASLLSYLKYANILNHNLRIGFMRHPKLPKFFDFLDQSGGREIFNVHHQKWYIFDNKVILSGANLQQEYFLHRQDRYIVLHDVEEIADYLDDAQQVLMQHSFQMNEEGHIDFNPEYSKPHSRRKYFEEFHQSWKMFQFSHQYKKDEEFEESIQTSKNEDQQQDIDIDEYKEQFTRNLEVSEKINEIQEKAKEILSKTFDEWDVQNIIMKLEKSIYAEKQKDLDSGEDVHLFISFHLPYLQTSEDQDIFITLFSQLSLIPNLNLCIASGYMNFTKQIVELLKAIKTKIQFVAAGPTANGFYKAGRYKSYIPYFYRQYEINLLNKDLEKRFEIFEYGRKGWTFHAKGIWASVDNNALISVIGSSNFSERSLKRDNEIQLYLYSKCPVLNQEFKDEQERLLKYSKKMTAENLKKEDIKCSLTTNLLSRIFKNFL